MSEEKKNEVMNQAQALSDQELGDVTGGKDCYCVVGGGGEAEWGEKTCACALGGGGQYNAEGQAELGKEIRCFCALGGGGTNYSDEAAAMAKEKG